MLLGMLAFMTACQDDSQELGRRLDKSEIKFRVEQAYNIHEGGNTVILINETPGTVPIWDYGTGRSNRMVDTVQFPFEGEYPIKLSVLTAGGVVEMDPVTVQVTKNEFSIISDPMWINISGGPGEEKTWLLDLDENGVSKFFDSPVYFSSNNYDPDEECLEANGCWFWPAAWKGNQWIGEAGDYGTMTFSLKGGPYVTVDHNMIPALGEQSGTYFIDTKADLLMMTDAMPLQNPWADNDVEDWSKLKIISLTENTMQLAAWHGSKEEFLIFNYISEEYADNWVPGEPEPDPNFDFGADQKEILAVDKTTSKTWKLDTEVPYNWANLQGGLLNEWNTRADIMATGWAPYGDADVENIDGASITFTEDGKVVVVQDNGTKEEGEFVIDEATNIITFENIRPSIPIADWVTATTTEGTNQWKIVKVEKSDVSGKINGIWFGVRAADKDEYMVFHFKLQAPGAAPEPTPAEIIMQNLAGSNSRTWQLDEQVPFDWTNLEGTFLNGWTARSEYPEWAAYNDSHVEAMNDASIKFATDGTVVVTQDDGTTSAGTFTIDGPKKEITFHDITPVIPIGGWAKAEPTAENIWKIIKVERNANKEVTGIWFGKRDPAKDEYMVFHFVLE